MFSAMTRDELARVMPESRCCKVAELSAFARMTGRFVKRRAEGRRTGGGQARPGLGDAGSDFRPCFEMATESAANARKVVAVMRDLFDIRTAVQTGRPKGGGPGNLYVVRLPCDGRANEALREIGVMSQRTPHSALREGLPWKALSRRCCRRAYLRGAFLARGYVQDPERAYHMELTTDAEAHARGIARIAQSFGVAARMSRRKRGFMVYVKGGDDVVQFLRVVGAHASVIALESVRVVRGVRGDVNRVVNCETANLTKAVEAGLAQVEAIKAVAANLGMDSLPCSLQEIARLRLDHPEATLKELGEMLVPPITKSAANHRMRRLIHLAGQTAHTGRR